MPETYDALGTLLAADARQERYLIAADRYEQALGSPIPLVIKEMAVSHDD
jgi:hypothetical protein